jgi:hypothetical protein
MSYEIDVATVTAVLLADGWHRVQEGSFGIEPYSYVVTIAAEGKQERVRKKKTEAIPAVVEKAISPVLGARWTKRNGQVIACPVSSLLALRHDRAAQS